VRYTDLADARRDGRSGRTGVRPHGQIGIHSVRGGSVVGEHRVLFLGEHERIELVHAAGDRSLFAEGALRAARWMTQHAPGRYTMTDVLGIGR
jgi:4-hydroxy-tetrahydrodipicolinate reductase